MGSRGAEALPYLMRAYRYDFDLEVRRGAARPWRRSIPRIPRFFRRCAMGSSMRSRRSGSRRRMHSRSRGLGVDNRRCASAPRSERQGSAGARCGLHGDRRDRQAKGGRDLAGHRAALLRRHEATDRGLLRARADGERRARRDSFPAPHARRSPAKAPRLARRERARARRDRGTKPTKNRQATNTSRRTRRSMSPPPWKN